MQKFSSLLILAIFVFLIAFPTDAKEESPATAEPPQPAQDPVDAYVGSWTKTEGLFTYYTDETTRRVVLCIEKEQLEKDYLSSYALSKGTGSDYFAAPMMWDNTAFRFRRSTKFIEVYEPDFQFTTVQGEPMARAVATGISETILARVPIEAESETDGRCVIDLSAVLLGLSGVQAASMTLYGSFAIVPDGSYVEKIKGFPQNDEIDVRVAVAGTTDPFWNPKSGEARIGIHFSISLPPEPGYVPRLEDDRVGIFTNVFLNYSVQTDREDTRYLRYINRWRLEKKDPSAELSEPVKPIVFYLENTIPHEYRDAVRDGILVWNDAFERIGFKNAIVVRQMPDDADWDPADIRYHTIRWFVAPPASYAIGPCLTDPRTGEIYDADIGINADMVRVPFSDLEFTVGPLLKAIEMTSPPGFPALNNKQVRWDENTIKLLKDQIDSSKGRLKKDFFPEMHALDAAFAYRALRTQGKIAPGSKEEARFVHDYLMSLVAHEVGHVLGLRHNFAGSAATPYSNLNRSSWTKKHGLSSSIMDYTSVNISPRGQIQGEYFQTTLGDYDYWAIEYAYKPLNAKLPQDEEEELNKIASRSPMYRYGSDEDAWGWTINPDPDCWYWDMTDDPVRWYSDRITISKQLIDGILSYWNEPDTRPVKIRTAFSSAMWNNEFAARGIPRLIGGVRVHRDHVGDPNARPAMNPVSADEQRRALKLLADKIWAPDSFRFDPALLSMLGVERSDSFEPWSYYIFQRDVDIHSWVLRIQTTPLYWIYDARVLQRVLNNQVRMLNKGEVFTMNELFQTVRNAIWTELSPPVPVNSYRRNLQRAHLSMLIGIVLDPATGTPEDAVTLARRDLIHLKSTIASIIKGQGKSAIDPLTVAHLDECLSRIELALQAPMYRSIHAQSDLIFW